MRRGLVITIICLALAAGTVLFYIRSASTSVALDAEPSVVAPGESVTITITNNSEETVGWGYQYELHRRVGDDWTSVPLEGGFQLPLLTLPPGETRVTNEINQALEPGTYRVTKSVSIPPMNRKEIGLSTTFTVD